MWKMDVCTEMGHCAKITLSLLVDGLGVSDQMLAVGCVEFDQKFIPGHIFFAMPVEYVY